MLSILCEAVFSCSLSFSVKRSVRRQLGGGGLRRGASDEAPRHLLSSEHHAYSLLVLTMLSILCEALLGFPGRPRGRRAAS